MADTLTVRVALTRGEGFSLDLAFEAPAGVTVLCGPSGSGKSTALACIAGWERPTAGRIALGDDVLFDAEARLSRPIHQRHIAFVFQSGALFPHLDALGNVAYGIDRTAGRVERKARALAMLERMHVAHLAGRKPATFSGGETQRVALARAFATEPRLVLLDEPFSALDRERRQGFLADVRRFVDEVRVPLLHVTHDLEEARALADQVLRLEGGRIVARGRAAEVLAQPMV